MKKTQFLHEFNELNNQLINSNAWRCAIFVAFENSRAINFEELIDTSFNDAFFLIEYGNDLIKMLNKNYNN